MTANNAGPVLWQCAEVTSPHLDHPVAVVAAKDIPYLSGGDRFQTLSLYLPDTAANSALVGTTADALPEPSISSAGPSYLVHVHGGAWRDPELTSASIEPTVAHAFADTDASSSIIAIASVNYRLSQFPTSPRLPYDADKDGHSDPSREAVHPQHLGDVLHALAFLRSFGLIDQSYILSGHSCGACLALQAVLRSPPSYGLADMPDVPCPAAMLGLNGLYDLPALVHELGASHEHLRGEYATLLSNAFGGEEAWPSASPARFDPTAIAQRVSEGEAPRLVVLDQSAEDQMVPTNQKDRLQATLSKVDGLRVVSGHRCTGKHAAPWEQGIMIWKSIEDTLALLSSRIDDRGRAPAFREPLPVA